MATSPAIRNLAAAPDTEATMPALFIGHGSPMHAIEDNEFSRAWAEVARSLPKHKAVLCVGSSIREMGDDHSNGFRVACATQGAEINWVEADIAKEGRGDVFAALLVAAMQHARRSRFAA